MRKTTMFLLAAMAAGITAGAASAQEFTLRMAKLALPMSTYTEATKAVPDIISKATNGRVKVEVYDSLIPGSQLHTAVRDGRVDMAAIVNVYLSSEDPRITLSNLPGLVETLEDYKTLHDKYWGDLMQKVWRDKYNSVSLTDGVWSPQVILSKVPIRTVEDFHGLKIRVHNTEVAFLVNALGARSTPIAAAEMLPALDRGVVDAVITSPAVGYGLGFADVAKYMQLWPFATRAGWSIVINQDSLSKLPDDVQEQIRTAMAQLEKDRYEQYDDYVSQILAKWRDKGVELYTVPAEEGEKALQEKYTAPVYDAWEKRMDEMGLDGQSILKNARQALGR